MSALDPRKFRITGPAVVSVSGGRTSGYMLWRILDAQDGKLPPDVVAIFANTGREMPATLDFVDEMARRWGVHIHWLEYRRDPETGRIWAEPVSHNGASRRGEPFEMMLEERQWLLPGPKLRFCTTELKVRTAARWVEAEPWWAEKEARSAVQGYTHGRFRIDRAGYAEIAEEVRRNPRLPGLELDDSGFDVFADCEGGCGI